MNLKDKWLTPKDIEEQLGWSISRQATLRSQGVLEYHKFGAYVHYDIEYINTLLESGKVPATVEGKKIKEI